MDTFDQAQAFTTGTNEGGYSLTSAKFVFASVTDATATYAVGIWSSDEEVAPSDDTDTQDEPRASLGTLTCPGLTTTVIKCTTTGIDLVKETTYLLVIDSSSDASNSLSNTSSDSEDSTPNPPTAGWSIADNSIYRNRSVTSSAWFRWPDSQRIRINGTAEPANNPAVRTSAQDDDGVSDRETLAHTASGGDYGAVRKNLPVRIEDDETPLLVMTVEAVEDTVKEGEPVRYRIIMSRPITGQNFANVESVYSYRGNFVRNGPASVVTSVFSRHGKLYVEKTLDTLDDAVEENDGSFTVRIQWPERQSGIDLYGQGEEYTVGTPRTATVTILDNDPEEQPDLPIASMEPASVMEGSGAELVFRVRLNIPAPRPAEIR